MKIVLATVVATAVTFTAALPAFAHDATFDDPAYSAMPAEVRANIAKLREHGTRFEKAIEAIEAEWLRPSWTFGPDCEGEAVPEMSLPEPAM